jgi:hypothetical protein
LVVVAAVCAEEGADDASLAAALAATRPIADLRLRYEHVDQDGLPRDAVAETLRSRLGFETGKLRSWSLLGEAELVWPADGHGYDSTLNGETGRPVVADPRSHEVNRLQLSGNVGADTSLVIGRQRILYDDHRFVGNVGWRQNEQTFDAVRVVYRPREDVTADFAYINQVNRVFGEDSPVGRFHGDSFVANVAYAAGWGKLTGVATVLDLDEAPADSATTLGVRYAGERAVGEGRIAALATVATQAERGANPLEYREELVAAEVVASRGHWSAGAGIELLGGDGTKGFSTPLATLHRFQGWADKFLATPPDGIDDRYVTLAYTRKPLGPFSSVAAQAVWHRLRAERGPVGYGDELDLQLQATWQRFVAMIKYADYDADQFSTDTRKLWLQLEYVR